MHSRQGKNDSRRKTLRAALRYQPSAKELELASREALALTLLGLLLTQPGLRTALWNAESGKGGDATQILAKALGQPHLTYDDIRAIASGLQPVVDELAAQAAPLASNRSASDSAKLYVLQQRKIRDLMVLIAKHPCLPGKPCP